MLKKLAFCLTALAVAVPAEAGFVDVFNGVTIGKQLPKNDLVFLGSTPSIANKVQLIDFWATTCEPCRTSIPKLNAFHRKYASKGLVMIGVSEEPKELVERFLERLPIHYASAVEGTHSLHKALRIRALPYALVVDRSGVIVWRGQPEEITEQLIESLLSK